MNLSNPIFSEIFKKTALKVFIIQIQRERLETEKVKRLQPGLNPTNNFFQEFGSNF